MDAVQKANSGHPGTPMALAPLADVLWTRVMKYDASEPDWPDRDRFVLSAGHASMLLYSMLYLTGFGLELDDLREFRQWGSRTPGHPEYRHTKGVEITTGPLGQGFGNAVGFAIAEKHLRSRFGAEVCDHHVFGICSDGDLMEGVSHEAASLAGHLRLGRLVFVYDDNHITIDGDTALAYSDDVPQRFEGYGWHVVQLGEAAEDTDALEAGLRDGHGRGGPPDAARAALAHRLPVAQGAGHRGRARQPAGRRRGREGQGDPRAARRRLPRRRRRARALPRGGRARPCGARGVGRSGAAPWTAANPARADEYDACLSGRPLGGWEQKLPTFEAGTQIATRDASKEVLTAVADLVPGLIVGSADLTGNTGMAVKGLGAMTPDDASGRGIHYGIREHGMSAAANGMAVSGLLPTVGTFFVFSDYARPAVRLASIMQTKVGFVWTHDSVGVGEDGPTHQPIEQLASLRAMPGLRVIRPADANEVAAAWRVHLDGVGPVGDPLHPPEGPGARRHRRAGARRPAARRVHAGRRRLARSRPHRDRLRGRGRGRGRRDPRGRGSFGARRVDAVVGSLRAAARRLPRVGPAARSARRSPSKRASRFGWERYADDVVSIDRFGASAPGDVVMRELGITPEHVVERALALLGTGGS